MKIRLLPPLLACIAAAARLDAAVIATEAFDADDGGWIDRDPGEMSVSHDAGFGLTAGSLHGSFASQPLAFVQTDAFRATNTSSSASFVGNYWAVGATAFTFDFYAEDVLPSDLYLRLGGNGSTFFYAFSGQVNSTSSWYSVTVPFIYSAGWIGGTATTFSNALAGVQWVDVQVTRAGTSAQDYWLDNFTLTDQQVTLVPEPGTGLMALVGLGMITLRRKLRRVLRGRPVRPA